MACSHVMSLGDLPESPRSSLSSCKEGERDSIPQDPQVTNLPDSSLPTMPFRETKHVELSQVLKDTLRAELSQLKAAIQGDIQRLDSVVRDALERAEAVGFVDQHLICDMPVSPRMSRVSPHGCQDCMTKACTADEGSQYEVQKSRPATPGGMLSGHTEAPFQDERLSRTSSKVSDGRPETARRVSKELRETTNSQVQDVVSPSTPRALATHSWKKSDGVPSGRHSLRKSGSIRFSSAWRRKLLWIISHQLFDNVVAGLILLNGIIVGIQTDYMARHLLEDPTEFFQVIEVVFCSIFTAELAARLTAHRWAFFTSTSRSWNIFELLIVILQLVELSMSMVAARFGFNFNFLRILRMVRVVRLARALRLIRELKTLVNSIAGSIKPLFWSCILLFMVAYVAGVAITQLVHSKKVLMVKRGEDAPDTLDKYWKTLVLATWTLVQAITGGVDWNEVCRPLIEHVGVEVGVLFTCYILFSTLAMLNVVTGVFIDSVMQHGRQEKEVCTRRHVQALFKSLDVNHEGEITWQEFENHLHTKEMKEFFKIVDVDLEHAKSLFELLDLEDTGALGVREFMEGCLKIWAPARGLDLRMIMRDIIKLHQTVISTQNSLRQSIDSTKAAPETFFHVDINAYPNELFSAV